MVMELTYGLQEEMVTLFGQRNNQVVLYTLHHLALIVFIVRQTLMYVEAPVIQR